MIRKNVGSYGEQQQRFAEIRETDKSELRIFLLGTRDRLTDAAGVARESFGLTRDMAMEALAYSGQEAWSTELMKGNIRRLKRAYDLLIEARKNPKDLAKIRRCASEVSQAASAILKRVIGNASLNDFLKVLEIAAPAEKAKKKK